MSMYPPAIGCRKHAGAYGCLACYSELQKKDDKKKEALLEEAAYILRCVRDYSIPKTTPGWETICRWIESYDS